MARTIYMTSELAFMKEYFYGNRLGSMEVFIR